MFDITRNAERYHFKSDWLSSYWHFSFDHYYDPDNVNFGPLRVFNDDVIRPASGFPTHGHYELEIVTYVLEGELEHKDSTGAFDRIKAGEVQRMSAGTGISHSEYNPSSDKPVHFLQMWILPAVQGLPPSYEQLRVTREQRTGTLLPVASGQDLPGTVKIHQDTTIYVSTLRPGEGFGYTVNDGRRVYLFTIGGMLQVNEQTLAAGDEARITQESALKLTAVESTDIILLDLP